jgi:predicted transcriptional regulator of viral defense system
MNFIEFKETFFPLACINTHQVIAWKPDFDRNNITRWLKKGYLIGLRQGYFTFPEYKTKPDYAFYFANRMYKPSYISLHTALSFYGMIPESVVQITSVSSLKTAAFKNDIGTYSYQSIKENLLFGYELKSITENRTIQIATPEKALLDLLYLYPFYDSEQEMLELRLDEDFMQVDLNKERLNEYSSNFKNKALDQRLKLLIKTYDL